MPNPRPFGHDKVKELIGFLSAYGEGHKSDFEYRLGIAALKTWVQFSEDKGWEKEREFVEVKAFLSDKESDLIAGSQIYYPYKFEISESDYAKVLNRHSVRDYQEKKLTREDYQFALECFAETPTACNRQMCRVYYIENEEVINLLKKYVIGLPGFNKNHVQFFVVTYDIASFVYSGERQQGLFNAGLCTMSFVNGLHVKGIGSCCLQWSNKDNEDSLVREKMHLPESERIAVVVGAGYYLKENVIPCSVRKSTDDIFDIE